MVPFFIIEMLVGVAKEANASGGNDWARTAPSSGDIMVCGSSVIFAMPRLALNVAAVTLTLGKYFVKASRRCSCAASMSWRAERVAWLFWSAESVS